MAKLEIKYSISYFMVLIFAYPFITIGMTCSRIMQGLGHGTPMLILTILRVVIINSALAWYFVIIQGKPIVFAWYSILTSCIITSLIVVSCNDLDTIAALMNCGRAPIIVINFKYC